MNIKGMVHYHEFCEITCCDLTSFSATFCNFFFLIKKFVKWQHLFHQRKSIRTNKGMSLLPRGFQGKTLLVICNALMFI